MLEGLELKNFKAAKDVRLKLSPLTVLSGLNSSGKSSVLQALALMRQSFTEESHLKRLHLYGPLVQLGAGRDVLTETASDEFDVLGVSIKENGTTIISDYLVQPEAIVLDLIRQGAIQDGVFSSKCAPPQFVSKHPFQFLSADRIVPRTTFPQNSQANEDSGFLGLRGEYTADYLAKNGDKIRVPKSRQYVEDDLSLFPLVFDLVAPTEKLIDQAAGWLQKISPGVRLKASQIANTDDASLLFEYVGKKGDVSSKLHRPTNVGFGLTYSLPIIVACLAAKPKTLLLLENPEAHLHPMGQSALGELLARTAADGVQIIVETHSDHLLNGLRVSVKKKIIQAEDVSLHFFSREIKSGETYVQTPTLSQDGRISNWPKGFFDQWDTDTDRLLGI